MKIAWIGTGVMGKAMVSHLISAGYEVNAYNRTFAKLEDLKGKANLFNNIKDCVKDCDFIFTMVSYPKDVEDVYFGEDGIIENAKKDAILIDMTTSSPLLAEKINQQAKQCVLDAPVSGGDSGAKAGTLSIMVGGDKETYEKAFPLFEKMGTNINYIGPSGYGQHCKMCNQIAVAGATAAYSEALVYMKQCQLDPNIVLKAISSGAAGSWQIDNMAPRVLANDFDPGFFIKHFTKDMRIAKEVMKQHNINLAMLDSVYQMYEQLENNGFKEYGTQALIKYYDEQKKSK
ncbi:MAG: NAD(P)-dependent oxidoreductase [Erysipelotrichia bacterium]|nr:NAD(P)-dependent oxidoreductase [Erysipelotrichia bacterium]NCC55392.1 NAD(P)-dependent oxidoreductase [Erysipelotrichia bacterium]